VLAALVLAVTFAGCGHSNQAESSSVRLIAHDSFVVSEELLTEFEQRTGLELEIITAGDAGTLVGNAVLNDGDVGADVLFGVDDTLLLRALEAGIFQPHQVDVSALQSEFQTLASDLVVPIDHGNVCINIDREWYESRDLVAPTKLTDLTNPAYRGHLVVPDPAYSSPGLAFLLATVAYFGESGFEDYWRELASNDVLIVGDWTQAYVGNFTAGGGGGERPAVVSYSTSPPAEIIYATPPAPKRPKSEALTDGCYRQIEFAGVLKGSSQVESANQVLEWLISSEFQNSLAETMFVLPTRAGVQLPKVFTDFATEVEEPLSLPPDVVAKSQSDWLTRWEETVRR
jgi:thiamine transport system substrate-binding protein